MKKLVSIFLTLVMIFSFATVTTFAADPTTTGSITINGVSEGNVYSVYKLLNLGTEYDVDTEKYPYTVSDGWEDFFDDDEIKAYISIDAKTGAITWVGSDDNSRVAEFAKKALAYAKDKNNNIAPIRTSEAGEGEESDMEIITTTSGETTIKSGKFSNLPLGYYLIDSTMGALCGLTTTNPEASINAKNGAPTIDKQVLEDSTNQWGAENTADIGQEVEYRVTINVHQGAENYVLHDTMADGLEFKGITKIEHVIPGVETHTTEVSKYSVKTGTDVTDGCNFEIHFTKEFCDSLKTNDKIIVTYKAMLNQNATIAGTGNVNKAVLSFGEKGAGHKSNEDTVTTYTYGFDLIKTDGGNRLLDGAAFKIYDSLKNGNEIAVVPLKTVTVDGEEVVTEYRRAGADEPGVEIVVKGGKVRLVGFDNGMYYLQETKTPSGYNTLTARQVFIISDGNLDAIFNGDIYSTGSGVHVVNRTGTMLPETGATGTTMFMMVGTIAVLGTGVLLVTKKRMSMIEE